MVLEAVQLSLLQAGVDVGVGVGVCAQPVVTTSNHPKASDGRRRGVILAKQPHPIARTTRVTFSSCEAISVELGRALRREPDPIMHANG